MGAVAQYKWSMVPSGGVAPYSLTNSLVAPAGDAEQSLRVLKGVVTGDVNVTLDVTLEGGAQATAETVVPYNALPTGAFAVAKLPQGGGCVCGGAGRGGGGAAMPRT